MGPRGRDDVDEAGEDGLIRLDGQRTKWVKGRVSSRNKRSIKPGFSVGAQDVSQNSKTLSRQRLGKRLCHPA
jgi:hypothetical protein